jgi:hypothetical protein
MAHSVELVVGGARIPLNDFAERIVANTVLGLVSSLREADIRQEIRLVVSPAAGAKR